MKVLLLLLLAGSSFAATTNPIVLYAGYLTKLRCEGKLLISAVGDPKLLVLEALPAQVGCGVLIKPLARTGRTNLALETTTGSISIILEIVPAPGRVTSAQLDLKVRGSE